MTDGVVVFNYATWALRFPELSGSVSQTLAEMYFGEAQALYVDNTVVSPIRDLNQRAVLLNLVTAHIAALNAYINGVEPSTPVGRVATATEGSVSVSTENLYPPGTVQWWQSTKYGSAYWAATIQFRSVQYSPNPRLAPIALGRFQRRW